MYRWLSLLVFLKGTLVDYYVKFAVCDGTEDLGQEIIKVFSGPLSGDTPELAMAEAVKRIGAQEGGPDTFRDPLIAFIRTGIYFVLAVRVEAGPQLAGIAQVEP